MEAPEGCPTEIYDIMKQAWDLEPDNRPTFSEVLKTLEHLRAITDWYHTQTYINIYIYLYIM